MFYTVEIRVVNGAETRGLYQFDTLDSAKARMYSEMAYGMDLEGCTRQSVAILLNGTEIYKVEEWTKAEEPEVSATETPQGIVG